MDYIVYSKPGCGFCDMAKDLLESKQLGYKEIIVDVGQQKDESKTYISVGQLRNLIPNVRSVPQIFKGQEHVGGYDDLKKMLG